MPLDNLLAATDLEGQSKDALIRGMYLSQKTGATLHVLYVSRAPEGQEAPATPGGHDDTVESRVRDFVDELVRERPELSNVEVVIHVEYHGRVHERILEHARSLQAELILIGRSSRAEVLPDTVLLTTGQVLAHAIAPVLVVTQPVAGAYRDVLVDVELTESPAAILKVIGAFGPDTRLTLLVSSDGTPGGGILATLLSGVRRRRQESHIARLFSIAREYGFDENRVTVELVPDDYDQALRSRLTDASIDMIGLTRMDKRLRHEKSGNEMIGALQTAACDILVP